MNLWISIIFTKYFPTVPYHLSPTRIGIFTDENWSPKKFLVPDPIEHKMEESNIWIRASKLIYASVYDQRPQLGARWNLRLECWPLGSCGLLWCSEELHLLRTSTLHIDKAICSSKLAFFFFSYQRSFLRNFQNIIFIF